MSVAIGIECDGGVWLAADSAISEGPMVDLGGGKLIKRSGYSIASVGYMRAEQVLAHYLDLPGPVSDEHVMSWAVTSLVPALAALADEHEPWDSGGPNADDKGWCLLVATCGVVLCIGEDLAVHRSQRGYRAIGSGSHVALGSLYSTRGQPAQQRAIEAVRAAAEWIGGVAEPVDLLWVPA